MSKKLWVAELTEVDRDIWTVDIEGPDRERVIKEARIEAKKEGMKSFRIGAKHPVPVSSVDVGMIIENIGEQMFDEVGEVAEDFLSYTTKDQKDELDRIINLVFKNWMDKYNLNPDYFRVDEIEVIKV